jgi:hypothetical protein
MRKPNAAVPGMTCMVPHCWLQSNRNGLYNQGICLPICSQNGRSRQVEQPCTAVADKPLHQVC